MEKSHGLVVILCAFLFTATASATQFKVGGSNGWTVLQPNTVSYNQWAQRNRFQISDSLLFTYAQGEDSVLLVNQESYNNCDTSSYIKKFDDGNTVFTFDRSGLFFFISGIQSHCLKKESLVVAVMANRTKRFANQLPASPPASPPSGSSASPPASPPSGSSASPPASPPSGSSSPPPASPPSGSSSPPPASPPSGSSSSPPPAGTGENASSPADTGKGPSNPGTIEMGPSAAPTGADNNSNNPNPLVPSSPEGEEGKPSSPASSPNGDENNNNSSKNGASLKVVGLIGSIGPLLALAMFFM